MRLGVIRDRRASFFRRALRCIRDSLPRLPGSEAVCIRGTRPGQGPGAQDEAQRRRLRVYNRQDGVRCRVRIAAFCV